MPCSQRDRSRKRFLDSLSHRIPNHLPHSLSQLCFRDVEPGLGKDCADPPTRWMRSLRGLSNDPKQESSTSMDPGERTALPKRRQNPNELVRQPEAGLCPLPHSHTSGHQSRAQTSETAPRGSQGELACMKAAKENSPA